MDWKNACLTVDRLAGEHAMRRACDGWPSLEHAPQSDANRAELARRIGVCLSTLGLGDTEQGRSLQVFAASLTSPPAPPAISVEFVEDEGDEGEKTAVEVPADGTEHVLEAEEDSTPALFRLDEELPPETPAGEEPPKE